MSKRAALLEARVLGLHGSWHHRRITTQSSSNTRNTVTVTLRQIEIHLSDLKSCSRCPHMIGPVVTGYPVVSPVMLIGQAPGEREGPAGKPFAWTAGKILFEWFRSIGLEEDLFRKRVYMAAVCRCFPGKNSKGGDRVPSRQEIANCLGWLKAEVQILKPRLIIPVGKLAIAQLMPVQKLQEVVGSSHQITFHGVTVDVVPLPHPSGASPWHRIEPGKRLLKTALQLLKVHPAWKQICKDER